MTLRLAVIPARGGSKRIPGKNLRDFCGKPMIFYILEAARQSKLFDVIHVSTESEEIAATVSELGFSVDFMRPADLADDNTPIMPVLKFVAEKYLQRGMSFDEVVLLMACAPLVEAEDLISAADLLQSHKRQKAVLGVAAYPVAIEWAFDRAPDGTLVPVQSGMFSIRSQDLTDKYFDAGMYCFFPVDFVLESEGAGKDDQFVGQVLPRYKAIDIDEPEDWFFAEAIYKGLGDMRNAK